MVCAISGVFDKSKSKLLGKSSLTFSIVKTELSNLLAAPKLLYVPLKLRHLVNCFPCMMIY